MATCSTSSTYTNILNLPQLPSIGAGDLLIVQAEDTTNTIDFENLIIPLKNTTFSDTITSHSLEIANANTSIDSLCSYVASQLSAVKSGIDAIFTKLREEDEKVVDLNPLINGSTSPASDVMTSSRLAILRALSSTGQTGDLPDFPWRTIQKIKTNTQKIEKNVWTTIDQLTANITRSTPVSRVRVQCTVPHSFYMSDKDNETKSDTPALFRILRNGQPIIPSNILQELGVSGNIEYVDGVSPQKIEYAFTGSVESSRNFAKMYTHCANPNAPVSFPYQEVQFYDKYYSGSLVRSTPLDDMNTCTFEVFDNLTNISNLNINYTIQVKTKQGILINSSTKPDSRNTPSFGTTTITLTELI